LAAKEPRKQIPEQKQEAPETDQRCGATGMGASSVLGRRPRSRGILSEGYNQSKRLEERS